MRVIVGDTRRRDWVQLLRQLRWGRMWTQARPRPYPGEPWGFDNGAYAAWTHGQPFPGEAYCRRLEAAQEVGSPYLAVLPDLVGAGRDSLDFSRSWVERGLPDWPWYLALQDGMEPTTVQCFVRTYPGVVGLFLGGTDHFKIEAAHWCDFAHALGLRFHYGRAGTAHKVRHALRVGADSLDSAFPLWEVRRFYRFVRLLTGGDEQLVLFDVG